jgi:aspartyl-tRNA(Asn)/glutamyl-tRNA(Gln) amidotransferase subunit C
MLARLGLSEDERARLGRQLEAILEHISRLQQVDTSSVPETAQVGDLLNVMRDDMVEPSLDVERVLANAPSTDSGYFLVGSIQGSELDG